MHLTPQDTELYQDIIYQTLPEINWHLFDSKNLPSKSSGIEIIDTLTALPSIGCSLRFFDQDTSYLNIGHYKKPVHLGMPKKIQWISTLLTISILLGVGITGVLLSNKTRSLNKEITTITQTLAPTTKEKKEAIKRYMAKRQRRVYKI